MNEKWIQDLTTESLKGKLEQIPLHIENFKLQIVRDKNEIKLGENMISQLQLDQILIEAEIMRREAK